MVLNVVTVNIVAFDSERLAFQVSGVALDVP